VFSLGSAPMAKWCAPYLFGERLQEYLASGVRFPSGNGRQFLHFTSSVLSATNAGAITGSPVRIRLKEMALAVSPGSSAVEQASPISRRGFFLRPSIMIPMSTHLHPSITRAAALATSAHAGQVRDDDGGPYIHHPERVAAALARHFPNDIALICAAWCHDMLEDCPQVAEETLRQIIGDDALALVKEVTNPSKNHPDLPRAERKAMDRNHIAIISTRAKLIKLADRADNMTDGAKSPDKAWIATYVAESRLLAEVLKGTDAGLENELAIAIEKASHAAGS